MAEKKFYNIDTCDEWKHDIFIIVKIIRLNISVNHIAGEESWDCKKKFFFGACAFRQMEGTAFRVEFSFFLSP